LSYGGLRKESETDKAAVPENPESPGTGRLENYNPSKTGVNYDGG